MGEIVHLDRYRRSQDIARQAVEHFTALLDRQLPDPEQFGWVVALRDEQDRPVRWYHVRYQALIGFVPGRPELVYLDYDHTCRAWELSIEELALGLETGTLGKPEFVIE